jgi:Tfp pilus assembly protein PilO
MNILTPIILILISFAAFFGYVDPNYRGENLSNGNRSIKSLQAEDAEYQAALNNTNELRKKRDSLVQTRGEIDPVDLEKLEKLLPDNIDNIKLVIDMNRIAQNHTLTLKNIRLETAVKSDTPDKLGQDNKKYGTVGLTFSVSSSYENFQNFLADLERSLRLVDITELSVTSNDTGVYDFSVGMKTYWLK